VHVNLRSALPRCACQQALQCTRRIKALGISNEGADLDLQRAIPSIRTSYAGAVEPFILIPSRSVYVMGGEAVLEPRFGRDNARTGVQLARPAYIQGPRMQVSNRLRCARRRGGAAGSNYPKACDAGDFAPGRSVLWVRRRSVRGNDDGVAGGGRAEAGGARCRPDTIKESSMGGALALLGRRGGNTSALLRWRQNGVAAAHSRPCARIMEITFESRVTELDAVLLHGRQLVCAARRSALLVRGAPLARRFGYPSGGACCRTGFSSASYLAARMPAGRVEILGSAVV